jgi:hypothetical protein
VEKQNKTPPLQQSNESAGKYATNFFGHELSRTLLLKLLLRGLGRISSHW